MKSLMAMLTLVLLFLQYELWLGEDSVRALKQLEEELAAQQAVNDELSARNERLQIEVIDLKNGLEAVEERARSELGMIRSGETYYLFSN